MTNSMRCKCGHIFTHPDQSSHSSYALINDEDYPAFIASEIAVQQCKDESSRAAAVAQSAKYVGFVLECPACSRLVVYKAGVEPLEFYKRNE